MSDPGPGGGRGDETEDEKWARMCRDWQTLMHWGDAERNEANALIAAGKAWRLPDSTFQASQQWAVKLADGRLVKVNKFFPPDGPPTFTALGIMPEGTDSYWRRWGRQPFYEPESPACRLIAEIDADRGDARPTYFNHRHYRSPDYVERLTDRHRDMTP